MTPKQFRHAMLAVEGIEERSHGGHPDFRLRGKVIASLGASGDGWAMLKLSPEQQRAAIESNPTAFKPCSGVYGTRGYTNIQLSRTTLKEVRTWILIAVEN